MTNKVKGTENSKNSSTRTKTSNNRQRPYRLEKESRASEECRNRSEMVKPVVSKPVDHTVMPKVIGKQTRKTTNNNRPHPYNRLKKENCVSKECRNRSEFLKPGACVGSAPDGRLTTPGKKDCKIEGNSCEKKGNNGSLSNNGNGDASASQIPTLATPGRKDQIEDMSTEMKGEDSANCSGDANDLEIHDDNHYVLQIPPKLKETWSQATSDAAIQARLDAILSAAAMLTEKSPQERIDMLYSLVKPRKVTGPEKEKEIEAERLVLAELFFDSNMMHQIKQYRTQLSQKGCEEKKPTVIPVRIPPQTSKIPLVQPPCAVNSMKTFKIPRIEKTACTCTCTCTSKSEALSVEPDKSSPVQPAGNWDSIDDATPKQLHTAAMKFRETILFFEEITKFLSAIENIQRNGDVKQSLIQSLNSRLHPEAHQEVLNDILAVKLSPTLLSSVSKLVVIKNLLSHPSDLGIFAGKCLADIFEKESRDIKVCNRVERAIQSEIALVIKDICPTLEKVCKNLIKTKSPLFWQSKYDLYKSGEGFFKSTGVVKR